MAALVSPRAALVQLIARSAKTVILLFIFPERTFSKEAIHASAQVIPLGHA
jgi:hypothetical protein